MKLVVVLLLLFGMNLAQAVNGKPPVSANTKWKEECGSCHVAYPPEMLSSENWQSLMGSLNKHFGSNATLDNKDTKEILGFLKLHAGSGERWSAASLRISDTPWFRREHRVISDQEWSHPEVKSRSNCSACHGKLVLGD